MRLTRSFATASRPRSYGGAGTAAQTRVLIDSSDGDHTWSTVGSSTNIIEASWQALADSLEYALLKALDSQG